jgi:pimeloyl-ACP methyl ester carboxylesterase
LKTHPGSALTGRERWLAIAVQSAVAFVLVYLLASDAVAFTMALAPNAVRGARRTSPPPVLLGRNVKERTVHVGPDPANLSVWVVEPRVARPRGTVVLLHGIRMDRRSLSGMGEALCGAGYRAVLMDLRGHGASSGRYLTYGQDEARDVTQVLDALEADGTRLGPLAVFGFSYGAAVSLDVAARDPRVKTAVAVSPFASVREVVRDYQSNYLRGPLKWLPDSWFQSALDDAGRISRFDPDRTGPENSIRLGSAPLLLIHGDADRQVPLRHSQKLEELAGARAKLVVVPGATHDSVLSRPVVERETLDWLARHL